MANRHTTAATGGERSRRGGALDARWSSAAVKRSRDARRRVRRGAKSLECSPGRNKVARCRCRDAFYEDGKRAAWPCAGHVPALTCSDQEGRGRQRGRERGKRGPTLASSRQSRWCALGRGACQERRLGGSGQGMHMSRHHRCHAHRRPSARARDRTTARIVGRAVQVLGWRLDCTGCRCGCICNVECGDLTSPPSLSHGRSPTRTAVMGDHDSGIVTVRCSCNPKPGTRPFLSRLDRPAVQAADLAPRYATPCSCSQLPSILFLWVQRAVRCLGSVAGKPQTAQWRLRSRCETSPPPRSS